MLLKSPSLKRVQIQSPEAAAQLRRISRTSIIAVCPRCLNIPCGELTAAEALIAILNAEILKPGAEPCTQLRRHLAVHILDAPEGAAWVVNIAPLRGIALHGWIPGRKQIGIQVPEATAEFGGVPGTMIVAIAAWCLCVTGGESIATETLWGELDSEVREVVTEAFAEFWGHWVILKERSSKSAVCIVHVASQIVACILTPQYICRARSRGSQRQTRGGLRRLSRQNRTRGSRISRARSRRS